MEWKAFCDILVPYFTKYWNTPHDCCNPVLALMKQTLSDGSGNDSSSGIVHKESFQKFTQEKSILRIFNDMAVDYLLGIYFVIICFIIVIFTNNIPFFFLLIIAEWLRFAIFFFFHQYLPHKLTF